MKECYQQGLAALECVLLLPLFYLILTFGYHSGITLMTQMNVTMAAESLARQLSRTPTSAWPVNLSQLITQQALTPFSLSSSSNQISLSIACYDLLGDLISTTNCSVLNNHPPTFIEVHITDVLSSGATLNIYSDWVRYE